MAADLQVTAAGAGRRRARSTRARRDSRAGMALVSPTVIVVLVMVVLPVLWALILSFQRIRLLQIRRLDLLGGEYTLRNYDLLFSLVGLLLGDPGHAAVLGVRHAGRDRRSGLIAALLVRRPFRGRGARARRRCCCRGWRRWWRSRSSGGCCSRRSSAFVNAFGTDVLGWDSPIPFLSQEQGTITLFGLSIGVPTALLMVIFFESWKSFPFAFLFILARLQAVPGDIEEAARVDGATPTQVFRHILLPQLAGVIALIAVLRFIFTFNAFDEIYLLTGGGAGTEVLATQVYSFLTARNDVGGSAAVAMFMAAVLAVLLSST